MKYLTYLYSIPLWILFWTTFTLLLPLLSLLALVTKSRQLDLLVHIFCRIMISSLFIFPRREFRAKEPLPYPVIFVANHVSFLDIFICGTVLPGYPRGPELKSHFNKPIYGWFITRFGQIPIEPAGGRGLLESLKNVITILETKRRNILIMPEGTRTRDGRLGRFKPGAFYLAQKTGTPVVPVVFKNLYKINNPTALTVNPGRLEVVFGEPIKPEEFENAKEMSEYTKGVMTEILEENDANR